MKLRTKNELFLDVVNWLIDEGYAMNQGDVAAKAGLGPNVISRIKKGLVKEVSEDTIRALVNHFDMLNIDYLRGKSEHITRSQKLQSEFEAELSRPSQYSQIDPSSALNAALSAQAGEIATLKHIIEDMKAQHLRELTKMEEMHQREITKMEETHKRELAEKDAHFADLKNLAEERLHRIAELRRVIDSNNLTDYIFPVGSAEENNRIRPPK